MPDAGEPLGSEAHFDLIREAAREVLRRVKEWQASEAWQPTERNRLRYKMTTAMIGPMDQIVTRPDVQLLVAYLQPVLAEWRPYWIGPEQAIYAAIDRLQDLVDRVPPLDKA